MVVSKGRHKQIFGLGRVTKAKKQKKKWDLQNFTSTTHWIFWRFFDPGSAEFYFFFGFLSWIPFEEKKSFSYKM